MSDLGLQVPAHTRQVSLQIAEVLADDSVHLQLQLGSPIDVRVLNDAPLAFRYHALQGRPLVVRDEEFLDELRARTWDDYLDFQPFARQYLREALGE